MKKYEKVEILIIRLDSLKDVLATSGGALKEDGVDIPNDFWL